MKFFHLYIDGLKNWNDPWPEMVNGIHGTAWNGSMFWTYVVPIAALLVGTLLVLV